MNRTAYLSCCLAFLCLISSDAFALELDQRPAVQGEWGYRPFDRSTPVLNPPGFTWRPYENASFYHLQVSVSRKFNDLVYETPESLWSAHCPPVTFQPGKHFWRYRAGQKIESGEVVFSEWSLVRSFEVTTDAVEFPLPTAEELKARMPKDHPRLFFRDKDIPGLKELAEGNLKAQLKELVAFADDKIENPPDTSDPPLYPEGTVRLSGEWKKIWWGNRRRTINVVETAATLAFVYRISGEEKYGRAARDLLMAFCEWDPNGATNYRYNDEAAMPGLFITSRAATWAWPMLSCEDRTKLTSVMRERGSQCFDRLRRSRHLWKPYSSHNNRAWHYLGEVALVFYDEIPEAPMWLDYVMTINYTSYPVWGDSDGGWFEGAAYWNSYTSRFLLWADILKSVLDIDMFQRPFYNRTGYYGMYLMPPGTLHGGFGDQTTTMKSSSIAPLLSNLAAGSLNAHWKWYAEKHNVGIGGGYLGLIRAARGLNVDPETPENLPTSKCFRGVGLAVMNTNLLDGENNTQIHFKSSPMGRFSHGYNSHNSFLLNIAGNPIFIRSGRRDVYGSPHHYKWMHETKSDNAILVNGKGQIPRSKSAPGRITQWATTDVFDVVEGEAGDAYGDILESWRRRIIFLKPDVIVIHDTLKSATPSTFQWLLHSGREFQIGDNRVMYEDDTNKVAVEFLEPTNLVLSQTDEFDPPPAEWTNWNLGQWHLTADAEEPAKYREFLTLININDMPLTPRAKKGWWNKTRLSLPEIDTEIVLAPGYFTVKRGSFHKKFRR